MFLVLCVQGNLLCCETCPVTMHAPCAGVCGSDSEKEWFCPGCRCAVCQKALHTDSVSTACLRVYYGAADCGREACSCHEYNDILNGPDRKRLRITVQTKEEEGEGKANDAISEKVYLGSQLPDIFLKKNDTMENCCDHTSDVTVVPWDAVKSAGGTWAHASCVKGFVNLTHGGKAWYNGKEENVLEKVVSFCSQGAIHVGRYACGATLSFQIIHPAAVSSSGEAQGITPKYSDQHRESLRRVLSSCLYILKDSYDEVWDSRTGTDLISMMLQGASKRPWVDFSDIFVAVMYIDSTVASVCCFRLLGDSMAEIPLITSRQEIRGCKAGMTLLSKLEQCLHVCGIQKVAMPAMYCPNHAYLPAFHPQGEPLPPPSQQKFGYDIAKANVVAKILSHRGVRLPGVPWVQKETNPLEWPEWREKCANIRIKLADSVDLYTFLEKDHIVIASEDDGPDQDAPPPLQKKQRTNCLDIAMKKEDDMTDNVPLQTGQDLIT